MSNPDMDRPARVSDLRPNSYFDTPRDWAPKTSLVKTTVSEPPSTKVEPIESWYRELDSVLVDIERLDGQRGSQGLLEDAVRRLGELRDEMYALLR